MQQPEIQTIENLHKENLTRGRSDTNFARIYHKKSTQAKLSKRPRTELLLLLMYGENRESKEGGKYEATKSKGVLGNVNPQVIVVS